MKTMPSQLGQSLTWDQGAEMSQHVQLRNDTGLKIYLCEPRSPWQRGTNENTNGLVSSVLSRRERTSLGTASMSLLLSHAQ